MGGQVEQHTKSEFSEQMPLHSTNIPHDDGHDGHENHWHTEDIILMAQVLVPLLMLLAAGYFAIKKMQLGKPKE